MTLSADQLRILQIVERSASALSTLGIVTIIGTFFASRYFRNPIDRLILINAFYNAFDVTATMISLSGPRAGNGSALCQFQGFLMQMFPLADVLWTLAMAIDVFLIVFYQYDARSLHRLEKKYIAAITGFTFIPAFAFLFVHSAEKGHMYGSVTLWCAVAPKWVLFRILFYYAPIWLAIFVVLVLYCLVGWKIVVGKRALRSVESDIVAMTTTTRASEKDFDVRRTHSFELTRIGAPGPVTVTTITSDYHPHRHARRSSGAESSSALVPLSDADADVPWTSAPVHVHAHTHTHTYTRADTPAPLPAHARNRHTAENRQWQASRSALSLRQYLLMPVMFFVVLLTIWVAPSTNRVASFVSPGYSSFPLYIAVGATGSLRGFWNGVVFLAVGMRSRQSAKKLERDRPKGY